jgi:CBS domain-containing protein
VSALTLDGMRILRRVAHPVKTTTVRQLMSHSIVRGDPRQSLIEAAAEMRAHRVSSLAVLDGDAIVGIITERDLLRAIADGRGPGMTHVSQYMTHSPHTIDAGELAAHAAALMVRHRVRHLPVTEKGRLAGFISARDLLSLEPWPEKLPIGEPW